MNAYDNMLNLMKNYPKNHYKFLELQQKVNTHISGLKLTANKLKETNVAVICNRDANRYQKLLDLVTKEGS